MNGLYRKMSDEQLKQQSEEARERAVKSKKFEGEEGNYQWLGVKDFEAIYFYILPPFSDRMSIYREVWKCFQMPHEKNKVHTAWRSCEIFQPGIGDEDPVVQALNSVRKLAGDKVDRMFPSRKVYINVLSVGKRATDEVGEPMGEFEYFPSLGPCILGLSGGSFDSLITKMYAPGVKPIFYPETAVMVELIRIGGERVKYSVNLMGIKNPTGFSPQYENLFEKFGNEKVAELYQNIPDLDKMWRLPDEKAKAAAQNLANTIRVKMGGPQVQLPGVSGGGGTVIPIPAPSQSIVQGFVPPGVGTSNTDQSPATPAATTAVPPWMHHTPTSTPKADPTPPAPATATLPTPTPATPVSKPVSAPAASATDVLSVLALDPTPVPPKVGNKPICFSHYSMVQDSPKGHCVWCDSCSLKMVCEMSAKKV
jgi:hypothetical protein